MSVPVCTKIASMRIQTRPGDVKRVDRYIMIGHFFIDSHDSYDSWHNLFIISCYSTTIDHDSYCNNY
jgi:hypothetical protein